MLGTKPGDQCGHPKGKFCRGTPPLSHLPPSFHTFLPPPSELGPTANHIE